MIDQVLVVDSRLSSRRSLIDVLSGCKCSRQVIEAHSFDDGLLQLESRPIDACFVGSSMNDAVAARFITEGIEVSRKPECAFIAVLSKGTQSPSPLVLKAGVHATLGSPFTGESFSQIVNHAILIAHQRLRLPVANAPRLTQVSSVMLKQIAAEEFKNGKDHGLPAALRHAAEGLRTVASYLAQGRLVLRPNGAPSLATRDAIRLVFERTFPTPVVPGSQEDLLIHAVVNWFFERVSTSHRHATTRLKETLLARDEVSSSGIKETNPARSIEQLR